MIFVLIGGGVWLTGLMMVVLMAWVVTSLTARRSFRSGTNGGIFCAGRWTKPEPTSWFLQMTITLGFTTSCFRNKQRSSHLYCVWEFDQLRVTAGPDECSHVLMNGSLTSCCLSRESLLRNSWMQFNTLVWLWSEWIWIFWTAVGYVHSVHTLNKRFIC